MTSLVDLQAAFVRHEHHFEGAPYIKPAGGDWGDPYEHDVTIRVETLAEAQGIEFLCPACFAANGGPRGTHMVICWSRSRGVPDDVKPGPGRWLMAGTGIHDLTLNADPPGTARSVKLEGGCGWHGYVTNGDAT